MSYFRLTCALFVVGLSVGAGSGCDDKIACEEIRVGDDAFALDLKSQSKCSVSPGYGANIANPEVCLDPATNDDPLAYEAQTGPGWLCVDAQNGEGYPDDDCSMDGVYRCWVHVDDDGKVDCVQEFCQD